MSSFPCLQAQCRAGRLIFCCLSSLPKREGIYFRFPPGFPASTPQSGAILQGTGGGGRGRAGDGAGRGGGLRDRQRLQAGAADGRAKPHAVVVGPTVPQAEADWLEDLCRRQEVRRPSTLLCCHPLHSSLALSFVASPISCARQKQVCRHFPYSHTSRQPPH